MFHGIRRAPGKQNPVSILVTARSCLRREATPPVPGRPRRKAPATGELLPTEGQKNRGLTQGEEVGG
jgi:hypothetical protein